MNTQLTPQYITTTHSHGQLPPNVVYLNAQGQIVTPHQINETRLHDLKEGLKKDKKKYKKSVAVAATFSYLSA
jgi:cation transport regulator ChaC